MSASVDSEMQTSQRGSEFDADYFLRGPETGKSNYSNYRWQPYLTIQVCKLIMRFLGAQKGDSVLDYGCAKGMYVKALIGLGYDAYGYDVSHWAIENCDPEVKGRVWHGHVFTCMVADYILAKDVLEHIPLGELSQVVSRFIEMTRKAALIIVPLAEECGNMGIMHYVSPIDKQDITHRIAWDLNQWLMFFQDVIDSSGRAFTVSGSYKMPGVKKAADPYPRSCGFFLLKRFEYE